MDLPPSVFGGDYVNHPNDLSWPELLRKRADAAEAASEAARAADTPPPPDYTETQKRNGLGR